MQYLYHRVPQDLRGNILYPLNALKEKYPDVYAEEARKYIGRNDMDMVILPLGCLWNDVLHLSAVHPSKIKNALIAGGMVIDTALEYFQIDTRLLEPENTTIYLFAEDWPPHADEFISFEPSNLEKYAHLPQATKDYYKQEIESGRSPLRHYLVPHILYKGTLDLNNTEVIIV